MLLLAAIWARGLALSALRPVHITLRYKKLCTAVRCSRLLVSSYSPRTPRCLLAHESHHAASYARSRPEDSLPMHRLPPSTPSLRSWRPFCSLFILIPRTRSDRRLPNDRQPTAPFRTRLWSLRTCCWCTGRRRSDSGERARRPRGCDRHLDVLRTAGDELLR